MPSFGSNADNIQADVRMHTAPGNEKPRTATATRSSIPGMCMHTRLTLKKGLFILRGAISRCHTFPHKALKHRKIIPIIPLALHLTGSQPREPFRIDVDLVHLYLVRVCDEGAHFLHASLR